MSILVVTKVLCRRGRNQSNKRSGLDMWHTTNKRIVKQEIPVLCARIFPISLFLMYSLIPSLKSDLKILSPNSVPRQTACTLCTLIQKTHTDNFVKPEVKIKHYNLFKCLHDSNTSSWLEWNSLVTFMVSMQDLGIFPFPRKGNLWCRMALHSPKKKPPGSNPSNKTLQCDTSPLHLHR